MKSLTACPLVYRTFLVISLSALTLSAQSFGSTNPAGNPQNFTLFRDQQVFVMHPGTKMTPWQTNVLSFDGNLNPTGAVSQLPWSGALPFEQLAIQAVAGRFLNPAKDDIALVQRSETNRSDLLLRFRDGSLPTTLSSSFAPRQPYWSDFFATSAGDLDQLYDANNNFHDEIAAAWIEQEPGGCQGTGFAVPHVAVVSYNDPAHPAVVSQRVDRADGAYATYCVLNGYDYAINQNQPLQSIVPQSTDNMVATAIGDFDGDGYNELAVAYLRGQSGIAITIVIYRYQNDGTNASLTPVNTFEIYNPNRSMVGTLSLAAGNFDGSGVDQLMVASAYWSGTPNNDGTYQKGTLATQPVVFLIRAGQGSGSISSAVSAGASTGATNLTVSLGNNAYLLRQVTISGATGSWAAINGAWQVTPTANGYSLPVDSSQFGSFGGQTVQVNVAAPLAQADTMNIPAFPGVPDGGDIIHVDDSDVDGRIRVELVPGLFRFDPNNGYDYRRRQVAMAWNARPAPSSGNKESPKDGDPHLAIFQVTNQDKISVAFQANGLLAGFQTFQTLSVAAGAFRGDNDTKDPTWSLFLSGVGISFNIQIPSNPTAQGTVNAVLNVSPDSKDPTKLSVSNVCYGKASADSGSPTYYGFVPPICQIWGQDARMDSPGTSSPPTNNNYLRMPAIAADLSGNSLKLGAPVHYEVTKPVKAQFILEQPPQHAAYFDDGHGPQVQTINRYPAFNTSMQDSQKRSSNSTIKNHTDWTVGASIQASATQQVNEGLAADDTGIGAKAKGTVTGKVAYDYDHVSTDYTGTADTYTVTQQNATGTDDVLIYNAEILDFWRYRIFGSGTDTGDPQKPYAYYDIVLPGAASIVSYPGGRDVDWYQPVHEPGNILSYPSRTSVCSPSDIGPITVQDEKIVNQVIPIISCSQQYYNGNSSNISLNFDHTTTNGSSTDYTHKVHVDLDVNVTTTVGASEGGVGVLSTKNVDVDVHGGADWGQLTTSDDSTSASTGITVNSPQGDSNHAYPYYPIFYDTDAGALKVAFAVGDLTGQRRRRWFLDKLLWAATRSGAESSESFQCNLQS